MVSMILKTIKKNKSVRNLRNGSLNGLKELVYLIENKAKYYAPVDTGKLKSSIYSRVKNYIGIITSPATYSSYQEDGTYRMSAANRGKGFFKPAIQFAKTRVSAIMGKNIRKEMSKWQ